MSLNPVCRPDAARGARVRPGEAGAGAQAAGGRAVDQRRGRAPRRRQPARRLLRPQARLVRVASAYRYTCPPSSVMAFFIYLCMTD